METPTFYTMLPAAVRYDKNLKPNEKLLFAEISALTNVTGYCYASNAYFQNLFDASTRTVQGWLNPTSSDAILAQSQTLVLMAQQLNTGNGDALRTIARMAQAIARSVTLDELTEEERDVMAHFKNPAMPSVAVTADAAIKIATARQEFASTDTFLEMIGFDQADILRIKAQEQRVRGQQVLLEVEDEADGTNVE